MKLWLHILAAIAFAGYVLIVYALTAKAHEAITGWHYPTYCCGESDCAHATAARRNSDGSLTVTTQHGTATFPANFKHEESPDGLIHACFTPSRLYCLYLAAGT
jgi:hypothetical protein